MPGTDVQQEVTIRLWKKSPGQAARQFCLIQVQLDLFGGATLVIEQGCIGGSRKRVERYTSESAARAAMQNMVRAKKRRGYVV